MPLTDSIVDSTIKKRLQDRSKSTSREDYAISQANDDNAITTAYTQLI
jgi:hypothetical protein